MTLVTTSWDDGHPLDLRVASTLARHGLRGTFYVPLRAVGDGLVSRSEMKELIAMGMEIGSHTVTHPNLTRLRTADLDRELRDSRRALEDLLGVEVSSFCYPGGKFNRAVTERAALAGYRLCRTTVDFQTRPVFDPLRMPVSLQLFPHPAATYYLHTLRYGNWSGLLNWRRRFRGETDPERLAAGITAALQPKGGVFHLWGHSWELEQLGLWRQFDRIAAWLGGLDNAVHLTNGGVLNAVRC